MARGHRDATGGTVSRGSPAKVTLQDVADTAEVHVSTVSRALDPRKRSLVNAETRQRIEQVAERLGYRPDVVASGLRRGRTGTIGVVVPDLGNPFYAPVIRGIENAVGSRDIMPLIAETQDRLDRLDLACSHLLSRRVDAVIVAAARDGAQQILNKLADQVPTVLAVRGLPRGRITSAIHDDVAGGVMAARHLLGLGHRRLAQLRGPDDVSSFRGRSEGFRRTLEEAGAELVELADQARLPTVEAGQHLMEDLLDRDGAQPTAVFAHNDSMALGAIHALRIRGLACPAQMSVVGYNDAPLTAFTAPPLTTIALPAYELGRLAAELSVALIENPEGEVTSVTLPPRFVERESTAPPS